MKENKRLRRAAGVCLAIMLLVVQFFAGRTDVFAASKQSALNFTDLSLSVGQSQTLKVSNAKNVKWTSSGKSVVSVSNFSQTGTTKKVAQRIQKLTGGDLLQIKPKIKYTSDYDKLTQVAQQELNKNARPKVTTAAKNIRSYDVIYVGYAGGIIGLN